MKILYIRLKNFNSLQGEQFINFVEGPLSETGIFAITGPTGAGKSSILDVITLALFNRMPRISTNVKGISRSVIQAAHAIITRGEKDSYAEVEYEVENRRYRSRWSISLTRNNTLNDSKMELSEIKAKNLEGEIFDLKKSEVPTKNEEIIGLNYEQFIKSILLSQGEFARFLKSSANQRGELLERITGTEIYREIGKSVFLRNKAEEEKLQIIKTQLEGILVLAEQEEEDLKKEVLNLSHNQEKLKEKLDFFRSQNIVIEEINKNNEKLISLGREKINLEAQAEILKADKEKLKRHNELLPYAPQFQSLAEINAKLSVLGESMAKLEKEDTEKKVLSHRLEEELLSQQTNLDEVIKIHENEKPKIDEARELDKEIYTYQNQLAEKSEQYKSDETEIAILTSKKKDLHNKIQNLSKEKERIQIWFSKNSGFDNLQEKLPLIQENYTNFKQSQKQLEKLDKGDFKRLEFPILNWKNAKDKLEKELQKLEKFCQELAVKLTLNKGIEDLSIQREGLLQRHKNLEFLKSEMEEEQAFSKELLKIKNEGTQISTQIGKLENEKQKLSNELEIQSKKLEELEIRKERQNLEAKFDNHRKELKENEACPLCGSTHHPFVKNYKNEISQITQLLKNQKKRYKDLEKQVNEIINLQGQKNTEHSLKLEQYKIINQKNNSLKLKLAEKLKKIGFNKSPTIEVINDLLLKIVEEGKLIKNEINLHTKLISAKNQFNELKSYNDNFRHSFDILQRLEFLLDGFLISSYKNLKIEDKIAKFIRLNSDFEKNSLSRDNLIKEITIIGKELELVADSLKNKSDLLAYKKNELTLLKNKVNEFINSRLSLVQVQDLNKYEDDLLKKIDKKTQTLNSLKNKQAVVSTQISEVQKQIIENQEESKRLREVEQKLSAELKKIIQEQNYQDIKTAKSYLLKYEKALGIQQNTQAFDNQQTIWSENYQAGVLKQEELSQKLKTTANKDEINEKIKLKSSEFEQSNQKIGAINQKLTDNELRKISAKEWKIKYQKQAKESIVWQQLKDMIGDAEGKKYSEFAQEYTLRHLITIANRHLKYFSDRYTILPSVELKKELMISDSYQGDLERSVSTLSGGETFMLSLAMALALADLAGAKTKIGSLFIDEGFGSLDQETLDLALDALEKLQVQSQRKIGIISHVLSLKERIGTQIAVEKQAHGYSKLIIK